LFLLFLSTFFDAKQFHQLIIRNEKVACSIHVSGTNEIKKPRYEKRSGVFVFWHLQTFYRPANTHSIDPNHPKMAASFHN